MESWGQLLEILERARSQKLLGPGAANEHLTHALGFADVAERHLQRSPGRFADLGTGGGVPGLALALHWPGVVASFIESSARRCAVLREWVKELGLDARVEVLQGRAEQWARAAGTRETFDLVTARSFARPAVTAEIAAGLVRVGGILVVSEPPESREGRWPVPPVKDLGFGEALPVEARGAHYACLSKVRAATAVVPRPVGRPGKRPLW